MRDWNEVAIGTELHGAGHGNALTQLAEGIRNRRQGSVVRHRKTTNAVAGDRVVQDVQKVAM